MKNHAARLKEYAYLWESGEWSLHITQHPRARVVFVFAGERPSIAELRAVRALDPRFTDTPIAELNQEVGGRSEWLVGEFSSLEARRVATAAKARGLKVRFEDASVITYVPQTAGSLLHIDDHELARWIGEEMQRRGAPVVHGEAD